MSEGLFAPLEGWLCLHGAIIIVFHISLVHYMKPLIVYIFSFPVEITVWHSSIHRKLNNKVFSII
jgi:hypothetical protein